MNRYSATFWEDAGDPAFSQLVISGIRFETAEKAEQYGREAFGAYFAGVTQVEWADKERPF